MSRTDKDAPYRVHVARKGRELHDHRTGVCDFEPAPRHRSGLTTRYVYRYTCGLEITGRYFYTLSFYSRTKLFAFYSREYYDRDNAYTHARLRDIEKLNRAGEDVDGEDVPTRQHRHSARWDVW